VAVLEAVVLVTSAQHCVVLLKNKIYFRQVIEKKFGTFAK